MDACVGELEHHPVGRGQLGGFFPSLPEAERPAVAHEMDRWSSAMTYKFAGALDDFIGRPEPETAGTTLTPNEEKLVLAALAAPAQALVPVPVDVDNPAIRKDFGRSLLTAKREHTKSNSTQALILGVAIGLAIQILRKILKASKRYQRFRDGSRTGFATDFAVDAVLLPSPYAASFGGFVPFSVSLWFGLGGIFASYSETVANEAKRDSGLRTSSDPDGEAAPDDMSTNSLVGGGIIAGDALAALGIGLTKFFGG